ncbi:hypothetical protein G4B88_028165 [Cannabis sativa]|uniref:AMP-dependent synthetase/ligase domain-containing protein n=1 Tax=Cannabis sativa TaxID=3483 RepID=A0A7J6HUB4_CANSA|nr:hypothetical protein G4B88_028165 [Cannabis sativa]
MGKNYKSLDSVVASDFIALGITPEVAETLHGRLAEIVCNYGAATPQTWINIANHILSPDLPFSLHQMLFYVKSTNMGALLEKRGKEFLGVKYKDPISSFSHFQEFSVRNPEVYWRTLLMDEMKISFSKDPECILRRDDDINNPGGSEWLPGGYLNSAKNCLNVNSNKKLNDTMIVWRDEGNDDLPLNKLTLDQLRKLGYALEEMGLEKGCAIAIDMPMHVDAVVIYLAIVLAGYDHIIRGKKRIPLYSRVVEAKSPMAIVIPCSGSNIGAELRDGDISWDYFLERAKEFKNCEFTAREQPPKAIPWTQATPLKAAADGWSHLDIRKGDVIVWPTNLGWMMGPWLVYASLLNGASIALYNGSPLVSGFAKFVQDAKVTMLGVVPSIVRSWKSTNCVSGYDWSTIRCFSSSGEASNVDEYLWLMGRANYKPVIEMCGGTEIGGAFSAGSFLQAQSLSSFSSQCMGCTLYILDNNGYPMPKNKPGIGELALGPVMFGASKTLLNGNHHDVYFKGMPTLNGEVLRRHGDIFELTSNGYYHAHGRADDTMNIGGIKISSIEIERVCNEVDDRVFETTAIGVPPLGGGPEQLVVFFVLKDSNDTTIDLNQLRLSFNLGLQKKLNPLFKVTRVVPLSSLPRTATNKIMRRVLRQQFSHFE